MGSMHHVVVKWYMLAKMGYMHHVVVKWYMLAKMGSMHHVVVKWYMLAKIGSMHHALVAWYMLAKMGSSLRSIIHLFCQNLPLAANIHTRVLLSNPILAGIPNNNTLHYILSLSSLKDSCIIYKKNNTSSWSSA